MHAVSIDQSSDRHHRCDWQRTKKREGRSLTERSSTEAAQPAAATTQRRSRRRAVWLYFQAENDTTATCIMCKKGVKYSGNNADLFKHVRNHAEENEELKKRREERNPPPDPDRPRGLSVKQCPGG